jgi:DNA-binding NtrC family response regulator
VLLQSVGALPFEIQAQLLKFVEEGVFVRRGGAAELRSTARLLVSSDYPLGPAVDAGQLRSDLFYRLQVLTIALPPLRDHVDDLERLASSILPPNVHLAPAALLALQQHSWPGNVRELEHVLWRAALLAENDSVELRHLALTAALAPLEARSEAGTRARATPIRLAEMEKRAILTALETTGGNKKRAAGCPCPRD